MAAALAAQLALSGQPLPPPPCTLARPHSTPLRAAALRMESDGSWWDLQQVKARAQVKAKPTSAGRTPPMRRSSRLRAKD